MSIVFNWVLLEFVEQTVLFFTFHSEWLIKTLGKKSVCTISWLFHSLLNNATFLSTSYTLVQHTYSSFVIGDASVIKCTKQRITNHYFMAVSKRESRGIWQEHILFHIIHVQLILCASCRRLVCSCKVTTIFAGDFVQRLVKYNDSLKVIPVAKQMNNNRIIIARNLSQT